MYKDFYGLTRNPFEVSPDPFFFYPTRHHTDALGTLVYGVLRRRGFVVVTGEVGTGKTLLMRCLLRVLWKEQVAVAVVNNPIVSISELLIYLINALGIRTSRACTRSQALSCLNDYLMQRSYRDLTTALVVDEAQLLSRELLEEIRLLTNCETTKYKLLQIVLLGQPQFEQNLDLPELQQLKQRIGLRRTLKRLTPNELHGYIIRRLQLAGANSHGTRIFPDQALTLIWQCSLGIPRLVNTLCENSLLLGFQRRQVQITWEIVLEAAADLRLNICSDISTPALITGKF